MADNNQTLQKLQKEISSLKRKRNEIDNSIKDLEAKRRKMLLRDHKKVYRIKCTPSKSNHVEHYTGVFSTYEKALKCIPESGNSHDDDDNCTWFYHVVEKDGSLDLMTNLDKHPSNFPYAGW